MTPSGTAPLKIHYDLVKRFIFFHIAETCFAFVKWEAGSVSVSQFIRNYIPHQDFSSSPQVIITQIWKQTSHSAVLSSEWLDYTTPGYASTDYLINYSSSQKIHKLN